MEFRKVAITTIVYPTFVIFIFAITSLLILKQLYVGIKHLSIVNVDFFNILCYIRFTDRR
jgi:hypothetical protein|nr:MAG TPA: hypothetical protein [Caudoviricetes sp.]